MALDTTKSVKSITYNNTEIPLYTKPEQQKTVTPTASGVTITPDSGYTLSKVTVNGDSNLVAGNIKSGTKIFGVTGTYNNAKTEQTKTVDLSMASGNQTVTPDGGKVLSRVTITKPSTLIPANIKKDVTIGGVTGTLEEGGGASSSGETWVLNSELDQTEFDVSINFTCDGASYSSIKRYERKVAVVTAYDSTIAASDILSWADIKYRKLTFSAPPTGTLLTWLQTNAVKQASDIVVQPSKSLTVTSNGTTTITPDELYDAIGKVDLTVNVSGETTTVSISGIAGHATVYCSYLDEWLSSDPDNGINLPIGSVLLIMGNSSQILSEIVTVRPQSALFSDDFFDSMNTGDGLAVVRVVDNLSITIG